MFALSICPVVAMNLKCKQDRQLQIIDQILMNWYENHINAQQIKCDFVFPTPNRKRFVYCEMRYK